jgi:type I restriction enzyme S subunit
MAEVKEMEKLPEGWKRVRLGEVCNLSYGKNLTINRFKDDGQYKVYGANGVIGYYDQYTHEEEVVLVSCRGEYSGVINISEPKSYITNNSIPLVIKDPNQLQTNSLYYCLKLLPKNNFVSGSAQPQVVINDLKLVKITFPEALPEQRKIVEILETVDSAIEKADKIIEKYKRIKKGLMQDLLTKGIDENGQIRSEETHRFKDSPLGRIPEEWDIGELGKLSFLKGRIGWHGLTTQEYLEEGDYYLITGVNFENAKISWVTCFYVDKKRYEMDKNIQLKIDDILVTKDGTIGKVAIVDELPKSATLGTGVFVLRPVNNSYYPKYLFFVFTSFIFGRFIENLKAGSTINHLYQKDFVLFKFPLPPLPEQHRIASILSQIDETIGKEQRYKEKLERIKQGLMEDLLTGKVRVNHLIEGVENVS